MRWSFAAALALAQIAAVAAYPGDQLFKRDNCAHDNCYRAIAGTGGSPNTAIRTTDCRSFQTTTTAPCTFVVFETKTQTAVAVTTTGTLTATSTQVNVVTEKSTETQILISTATSTSVVPETFTSVSVTTVTTIYNYNPAGVAAKRQAPQLVCGVVPAAHSPPSYASLCSGAVRYASACSCAGITAATSVQATATSTSTITVTTTPTVGTLTTQTVPETTVTTTTSSTTTQTSTTTTTGTSTTLTTTTTTTLQATPTITNKFVIQAGETAGTYVQPDAAEQAAIFAPVTLQNAEIYTLGANGQLTIFNSDIAVALQKARFNPVGFVSMSDPLLATDYSVIACTVASTKSPNGGYAMVCGSGNPAAAFPALRGNAWEFRTVAPTTPFPNLYAFSPYNAPA